MFEIVVAVDTNMGIGLAGKLPWHCRDDLRHFRTLTTVAPKGTRNAVIMGRRTWKSLPCTSSPLPGRRNIVLTTGEAWDISMSSLGAALEACNDDPSIHRTFVIGGARTYTEAIRHSACSALHVSVVDHTGPCDTFFPRIDTCVYERVSVVDYAAEDQHQGRAGDKGGAECNLTKVVTYRRRQ